jgi:Flp pilus assembly protein TadD
MAALPSADDAALAFAQVAYAIDYILEETGNEGYRRVVAETRRHGDIMRAVDLVMGRSGGRFEKRVTTHIQRQHPRVRANVAGFQPSFSAGAAGEADPKGEALDPVLLADKDMQEHSRVGDLLRLRGHVSAALLEYERAQRVGAFHSPALSNKRARALLKLGRTPEAAALLRESTALYPEYTPSVALLFELTSQGDDQAGAAALGERAIGLNPFDSEVHARLAAVYEALGRPALADRERRSLQVLDDYLTP